MKKKLEVEEEVFGGLYDGGDKAGAVAEPKAGEKAPDVGAKAGEVKPGEKPPEKKSAEEEMVPVSALKNERLRRQNAEGNINVLTQHIQTLQGQIPQKTEKADVIPGIDPDAVVTGKEVMVMMNHLKDSLLKNVNAGNANDSERVAELNVKVDHPDYKEVINTNLVNVLTAVPQLRTALASVPEQHRPLLAYMVGTMDSEYKKKTTEKIHDDITKRLQANANKPGSVHVASGAADETDLSKIIANESTEDFEKRVANVKANANA